MARGAKLITTSGAVIVVLILAFIVIAIREKIAPKVETPTSKNKTSMTITSPAFQNDGAIPQKYTCDGDNINPELQIAGAPEAAKSLALIMDDPDAPMGTFVHWTMWNLDPKTTEIKEATAPLGSVQGRNSANKSGYTGPCPPNGRHRYFFKLFALDTILDLPSAAGKNELESAAENHILAQAETVGLYSR